MELTERHKKLLKWVGYPLLAIVTLLMTISYTFPYERLEQKLVTQLEKKFNVSIASVGPTLLPGGVVIDTMMLETRPDDKDDEPAVLVVDRLKARVGLLRLLTGTIGVKASARLGEGKIRAKVRYGRGGLAAHVRSRDLPLDRVPVKSAVGLPMTGALELDLRLEVPEMRFGDASGSLSLGCEDCTIGDGEAKIKPKARPGRSRRNLFAQGGVTVPRIDLGTLRGEVVVRDGRGKVEELSAVSPDGELHVTGELELADPFMQSRFPGCIRFRLNEEFAKREPAFGNTNLWMPRRTLQDDGFYALPTEGTFRNFRWNTRRTCDGMPARSRDAPKRGRSRPSITVSPDDSGDDQDERERPSIVADDDEREDEEDNEGDDKEDEADGGDEEEEEPESDERRRDAERAEERRREIIERSRGSRGARGRERELEPPEAREEEIIEPERPPRDDGREYEDDEYEDDEYYDEDDEYYEDEEYDENYEDEPHEPRRIID